MKLGTVITAFALLSCSGLAQADPNCPQNFLQCNTHEFTSFEPRYAIECLAESQTGRSSTSYDLVSGLLNSFSAGLEFGAGAAVNVRDHYQLLGAPDTVCATLFRIDAHVVAKFMRSRSNADGAFEAFVRDINGFGPRIHLNTKFSTVTDTVLSMTLSQCPGDGFELLYELDTSAGGGSYTATMQIAFTNLHPLVSIASCQGFHTEQPVPTLPATWARVKSHYR